MSNVIVVTGATSGVGAAIVRDQLRSGSVVIATGRSEVRMSAIVRRATDDGTGEHLHTLLADLSEDIALNQLVELIGSVSDDGLHAAVLASFGHVGEDEGKSLVDVVPAEIASFISHSVTMNLCVTRALVPLLKAGDGRLIGIVADWGLPQHNVMTSGPSGEGHIGSEAFVAAKYAMTGLLASLERQSGVTACGLFPGVIASWAGEGEDGDPAFLDLDSSDEEARESGYEVPHDAIPLADIASSVRLMLATRSTVRTLVLKPRRHDYEGL